jgi:hypothetical protein
MHESRVVGPWTELDSLTPGVRAVSHVDQMSHEDVCELIKLASEQIDEGTDGESGLWELEEMLAEALVRNPKALMPILKSEFGNARKQAFLLAVLSSTGVTRKSPNRTPMETLQWLLEFQDFEILDPEDKGHYIVAIQNLGAPAADRLLDNLLRQHPIGTPTGETIRAYMTHPEVWEPKP